MDKKQIILGLLDIEYVFEYYAYEIMESLGKKLSTKDNEAIEEISERYFDQMLDIFQDIYEALDT